MIFTIFSEEYFRFRRSLVENYERCFSEYPWFEYFEPGEADQWFREILNFPGNICLGCGIESETIGAFFSFPLEFKEDVKGFMKSEVVSSVIYMAECFTQQKNRNHGVATEMLKKTEKISREKGFEFSLARTNFQSKAYPIFMANGYREIGRQVVFSNRQINGYRIRMADERGIFLKEL